jgi:allantoate deiminase
MRVREFAAAMGECAPARRGRSSTAASGEVPLDADVRASSCGRRRRSAWTPLQYPAPADAQNPSLSGVPTGMLFVRSTGGSHNPREFASTADAALATEALERAIVALAS